MTDEYTSFAVNLLLPINDTENGAKAILSANNLLIYIRFAHSRNTATCFCTRAQQSAGDPDKSHGQHTEIKIQPINPKISRDPLIVHDILIVECSESFN